MAADSIKKLGGEDEDILTAFEWCSSRLDSRSKPVRLNSRKSGPFGGSFAFVEVEKVFAKTNTFRSYFH